MFHVELLRRTEGRMFHVEHCAHLRDPTRITRRSLFGTDIGERHAIEESLCNLTASSWPSHRTSSPLDAKLFCAHSMRSRYPPRARAVMKSKSRPESPRSSNRLRTTSTPSRFNSRRHSERKEAFFAFDSISTKSREGTRIFKGSPGNPGPEPTSASRPFRIGRTEAANILSPKWKRKISSGSVIVVSEILSFHRRSNEIYFCMPIRMKGFPEIPYSFRVLSISWSGMIGIV